MAIDWSAPADPALVAHLVNLARPADASKLGSSHVESTSRLSKAQKVERLEAGLAARNVDSVLLANVIAGAKEGLSKTTAQEKPEISFREAVGLEAVIWTDGTRPSLPVSKGFVDVNSVEADAWKGSLRRFEDNLRGLIAATGKLIAPVGPGFSGTALLVADGIAMTNRHVAEAIARECDGAWSLRWPGETLIDFVAEDELAPVGAWTVEGIAYASPCPIGDSPSVAKLDVALLKCRPPRASRLTEEPSPMLLDGIGPGAGGLVRNGAVAAIGIAGRPRSWNGTGTPPPYRETQQVIAELFRDSFGVKRLAPGRVSQLPEMITDGQSRVFAHDCSTLVGNSGSAIVDLASDGHRLMGVHFGGISREDNFAYSMAAIRSGLPQDIPFCWSAG